MAQGDRPGLLAGPLVDLSRHPLGDAAEGFRLAADPLGPGEVTADGPRAFGRHDDGPTPAPPLASHQVVAHFVHVVGNLGTQNDLGRRRDAREEGDPAGVAAHQLDDEDAVVRVGGRVQPLDRCGRDVDRGVEAERDVGAGEVVVDRLRNTDDRDAVLVQLEREPHGTVAADRHERVQAEAVKTGDRFLREVFHDDRTVVLLDPALERIRAAAGAEDRAAEVGRAADGGAIEDPDLAGVEEGAVAAQEANDLPTAADRGQGHGPDHRVEAGRVAAAGADAYPLHRTAENRTARRLASTGRATLRRRRSARPRRGRGPPSRGRGRA